jgi:hypothetical protein
MNWKKTMLMISLLLFVPMAIAVSTTTTVWFNVASVVAYTLTLPGPGAVQANSTGAPTADIEFNTTVGDENNTNAQVVGGTPQSNGVPIFTFDNTGTAKLNISVVLNSNPPACMTLKGSNTYAGADTGASITTSPVSVTTGFQRNAANVAWYMKTDFNNCDDTDATTRVLTSTGIKA